MPGEYNGFTCLAWAVIRICISRLFSGPPTEDVIYGITLLILLLMLAEMQTGTKKWKMKKFLLMMAIIALSVPVFADQLTGLTLRQAKVATQFLLKQNQIILYCSCCDQSTERPIGVTVTDVWYEEWKDEGFKGMYSVYASGYTISSYGKADTFQLDLAYVYYNWGGNARCVATALFGKSEIGEIGPCNKREYFTWDERFFYNPNNNIGETAVQDGKGNQDKVPSIYSDFVIQNNRKEPFSVYINGAYVGRVSGYGELVVKNRIATSPSIIRVVQESGYLLYPSEYIYAFKKVLWGRRYTWKFSK